MNAELFNTKTMQMNEKDWEKLPDIPGEAGPNLITINDDQMILVAPRKAYKYNSISNKFESWIHYPGEQILSCIIAAFDRTSQILYIFGSHNKILITINVSTEQIKIYSDVFTSELKRIDARFGCLVYTKCSLHLIGGGMMKSRNF